MTLFDLQEDKPHRERSLERPRAQVIISRALISLSLISLSLISLSGCMDVAGGDLDPAESSGWERSGPGWGSEGSSTWDQPTDDSGAWTGQEGADGPANAVVSGQSCGSGCIWSSYAVEVEAQRPQVACGDGQCACVINGDVWSLCGADSPSTPPAGEGDDASCTLEVRSPDGRCDERCPQLDPDCGSSEGPASEPEVDEYDCPLEMRPDGECDLWCAHADPDCDASQGSSQSPGSSQNPPQDPPPGSGSGSSGTGCTREVVTPDGQCNQSCPDLDPDCGSSTGSSGSGSSGSGSSGSGSSGSGSSGSGSSGSGSSGSGSSGSDLDEYGCPRDIGTSDGQCNSWCADFDPDCGSSSGGSGGSGSGESDSGSSRSDLCEELGWYGDGECDQSCARPDPDCS